MQAIIILSGLFFSLSLYADVLGPVPIYYEYGEDENKNLLVCTFSAVVGNKESTEKKCVSASEAYFDQHMFCPAVYNDGSSEEACRERIKREGPVVELTEDGYCYLEEKKMDKVGADPLCKKDKNLNSNKMAEQVKSKFSSTTEELVSSYLKKVEGEQISKCQEAVTELASLQKLQDELEVAPGEKIGGVLYDIDAFNATIELMENLRSMRRDLLNSYNSIKDDDRDRVISGMKNLYKNYSAIQDLDFRVKLLDESYKSDKKDQAIRRKSIIGKAANLSNAQVLEKLNKTFNARNSKARELRDIFINEIHGVTQTLNEAITDEVGGTIGMLAWGGGMADEEKDKMIKEISGNKKFLEGLYLAASQLGLLDEAVVDPELQKVKAFLKKSADDLLKTVDGVLGVGKKKSSEKDLSVQLKEAQKKFHASFKRSYPSFPVEFNTLADYAGKNLKDCQEMSVGHLADAKVLDQKRLKECLVSMSDDDFNVIISTLKQARENEEKKLKNSITGPNKKAYEQLERNKELLVEMTHFHCENYLTGCQDTHSIALNKDKTLQDFMMSFNDVIGIRSLPLTLSPKKRLMIKDKNMFMEKIMFYRAETGDYSKALDRYFEDQKLPDVTIFPTPKK